MVKLGRKARIKAAVDRWRKQAMERVMKSAVEQRKLHPEPTSLPKLPTVLNEWQTLDRVLNGCSLSRFGDGEIKHMDGRKNVSQKQHDSLTKVMKAVFHSRIPNHLIAIPNVYSGRQFLDVADKYITSMQHRFLKVTDKSYVYGSAYISRGDLCGYLTWPAYWSVVSELWSRRDVVLVCGVERRANPVNMMAKARDIVRVNIPATNAWDRYQRIFEECLCLNKKSIFLLAAGPTATVLAADLARQGRWAVDIGHLGMFYRQWGRKAEEDA